MDVEDRIQELENKVELLEKSLQATYDLFTALFQLFISHGELKSQHVDSLRMLLQKFARDHQEDLLSLLP